MRKIFFEYMLLLLGFLMFLSCGQGIKSSTDFYEISQKNLYKAISDTIVIISREENVREVPNGEIIGKTMRNERFEIKEKRMNWLNIKNADFPSGYIWASSMGFDKIDIYSLSTWYDIDVKGFYRLDQYLNLLGSPSEKVKYFGQDRLNFYNIGFGFEKEIVMDQDGKSEAIIRQKGVGIVLSENKIVKEIHLDLRNELDNYKEIEKLMKIKLGEPEKVDDTRVAWLNRVGIPEIQLTRTEFKAQKFRQLILIF